jgi:DNA-directed RNA polymerase II subunit RPB1
MSVTQATTIDRQPVPAGITRPENYANGKPVYGGVNDPRMGSLDRRDPCKTCGCTYNEVGQRNRVNECPGHFGHIEVCASVVSWLWLEACSRSRSCVVRGDGLKKKHVYLCRL